MIRPVSAATIFAGCAGVSVQASQPAAAAAPPSALLLSAQIISIDGMAPGKIGPIIAEMGMLRAKTLVTAANGTVGVRVGTMARRTYVYPDETQCAMSGTAIVWLDNAPREVRAGDLIVISRGVVHGTLTASTDFESMAIKLSPQRAGDTRKML